jgi:uncharacterized membrane protein
MSDLLTAYLASLIVFLTLDLVWIRFIARNFYRRTIGNLLGDSPKIIPALMFYTLYILIMVYLVVQPSLLNNSLMQAAIGGALFGMIGYGTYSVTNYTILKNWPLSVAIIDLIWGAFVSSFTAMVCFMLL